MKTSAISRRTGITASFLFAMMIFASSAFSETVTIFGPKVYVKSKGAPAQYKDQFAVPAGIGDVQLIVTNGTDDKGDVKNVSVSVNGVEIVSSSDLRATGTTQKQISFRLLRENQLNVTLKGQGGNAVTVQLLGELIPSAPSSGAPAYVR